MKEDTIVYRAKTAINPKATTEKVPTAFFSAPPVLAVVEEALAAEEEAVELPEADPEADAAEVFEAAAPEVEAVAAEAAEEVVTEAAAEVAEEEEPVAVLLEAAPSAEPVDIKTAVVASEAADDTHVPATLLWKS